MGLLGELKGRCHTIIKEYPDWESFTWMIVDRPLNEWLISWWRACRDMKDMLTHVWGFKFSSIEEDLQLLNKPELLKYVPRRWGINQWVPENFIKEYSSFLEKEKNIKDYCIHVITSGIACNVVMLKDLNNWFLKNGFAPIHKNVSVGVL